MYFGIFGILCIDCLLFYVLVLNIELMICNLYMNKLNVFYWMIKIEWDEKIFFLDFNFFVVI